MAPMDLKLLEEIGLTPGEVKVYLALLKLGSCTTGRLASVAGVSSSKVYKILDRLRKKGLAGHALVGKISHFTAMEPARLLDYLEERREKLGRDMELLSDMLPELERQRLSGQKAGATVYEGFKAVSGFFRNIIDELNPGEEYCVMGAYYGEEANPEITARWRNFFHKHHLRRVAKGIRVKMLANHDIKGKMVKTTEEQSEIRYLPQYLLGNLEIVFYKNKVFLAVFTSEPVGFLIESKEAAEGFRKYFETFWKIAKP